MLARIYFGKGYVNCDKIVSLDCPNQAGGIGDIVVHAAEGNLWTGDTYLMAATFRFHFGNVTRIETRSTLYETDEPWEFGWEQEEKFRYQNYFDAADFLRKVLA